MQIIEVVGSMIQRGNVRAQEKDALTNKKAESAKIFRYYRKSLTSDYLYYNEKRMEAK